MSKGRKVIATVESEIKDIERVIRIKVLDDKYEIVTSKEGITCIVEKESKEYCALEEQN